MKQKNKELEYLQNLEIRDELYNINYNNSGGDIISNHPYKENIINKMKTTLKENNSKLSEQERKEKWGRVGEKNGMFGKTHTEEARKNISEKNTGVSKNMGFKHSDETRKKHSENAKLRTGDKNPFYKTGKTLVQEKNQFYGKKLSDEAKNNISKKNKDKKHPETSKKITIDNINYNSLSEASKKLNIHITTISWRIKSKNPNFDNYTYTDEESIKKVLSTKILINNIEYNSVEEASKKLNFTNSYISRRLNSIDKEDKEWIITDKKRDKTKRDGIKILINNIEYNSIKEASEKLKIPEATIKERLDSTENIKIGNSRKVKINDIIYNSVTEASKELNTNINVLIKRLKSKNDKFNKYIYLPDEYIDVSALVIMLFSLFLLISLNLINKFTFRVKNLNKF